MLTLIWNTLLKTIFVMAIVHFGVLLYSFSLTYKIRILNLFNILDFDLFYPDVADGFISFILSWGSASIIFMIIFITSFQKLRRSKID